MTQRVDFCMGDTMSICQSIIATNRLYLTEHHTLRVILSEAAQQCNGERESRQMPRSRAPKGRRQAESRHSCKALYPNAPTHQTGATAAPCQNSAPPQTTKTSPKSTRTMRNETTLCHEKAGALGGSSRREWEVWRERDASFKRRPSPSKVFFPPRSPPSKVFQTIRYLTPSSDSGESAAGAEANAFFALRSETGTW